MIFETKTKILVVDDDEVDRAAIERAFRRVDRLDHLVLACDGLDALEKLRGHNNQALIHPPYVILLDLNMPRMSGHEFLAELRADPKLSDSIVFVLTTSDNDRDLRAAYARSVAGYIIKSNVDSDFENLLNLLDAYVSLATFPNDA
ncbi:response regulator [Neorhodopirellula pilleata]|uniref:Response regulator rcp1 n=1 Tax=Neorhodopirellula pilleata TaxID=2714738 RepID=A0A5C6AE30_9BACT|nr:response regulator [Neorhodopirellula pilleata]TWT96493.1 Response regulator rcp1 [Neorhodopirellula pilleata]